MDAKTFFLSYYLPSLEFLVELIIVTVLLFHDLNRKSHFLLRSLLSAVLLIALSFAGAGMLLGMGNTALGKSATFLILFAGLSFITMIPFRESYKTLLFFSSVAYAVQNLIYKTYLFLWVGMEAFSWLDGLQIDLYWRIYRIASYLFFIGGVIGVWFISLRRISTKLESRKINNRMFFITFVTLLSTILLCSIDDVYFAKLSTGRIYHFDDINLYVLRENGNFFSILSCIVVLVLSEKSIATNELKQEVEYLKHTISQSKMQYEISKDTIERINVKCHDIKYKLGALAAENNLNEESLKELRDSVKIYDSRLETGNKMLNVLLWEKTLYCEQNGITLTAMVDGESLDYMEPGDLYCLFGNMIDNALEAVKNIADKSRRIVNLVAKKKGAMLLIQEENYFEGELTFSDGLPKTTKSDGLYHGFGTRSLRLIARKYGGELSCYIENDIFHLNIILPLNQQDK